MNVQNPCPPVGKQASNFKTPKKTNPPLYPPLEKGGVGGFDCRDINVFASCLEVWILKLGISVFFG
jgi:hypothetical protein